MTLQPVSRNGIMVSLQGYAVLEYLAEYGASDKNTILSLIHAVTGAAPAPALKEILDDVRGKNLNGDFETASGLTDDETSEAERLLRSVRANNFVAVTDSEVSLTADGLSAWERLTLPA